MNINKSWDCVEGKKRGFLIYFSLLVAFWCTLLMASPVNAQGLCSNPPATAGKGGFTVSSNAICLGQVLSVTTNSGVQNPSYVYIYNGSMNIDSLAQKSVPDKGFQYALPGSYTILQFGSNGATGTIACQVVTVAPTSKINYTYKLCSSSGNSAVVQLDVLLDAMTKTYDKILVNWGDGRPEESFPISAIGSITHTYTAQGDYVIRVKGGFNINLGCIVQENPQTVPVRARQKPYIPSLSSTGSTLTLQVQGNAGESIELLQKNGTSYQPTGLTALSGSSLTIAATQQTQCFKVRTTNGCGSVDESDEVCSLVLNAQAGNKQNVLSWQPYAGTGTFSSYRISRTVNGTGGGVLTSIANKATSTYTDANNIICGSQYCYQMQATVVGQSGQISITSAQTCVTGQSQDTPGAIPNMLVSVEDDGQVRVRTLLPTTGTTTNFTLIISRADTPAGPFQQVGTTTTNIFFDKSANPNNQSYCYQVVYRNECGNESPPARACTIWLTSKGPGIDWTADPPFASGSVSRYVLEIYDVATGTLYREIPLGGNTHYEPDPNDQSTQTFRYRIRAESGSGESTSNYYELKRNASIFVPTAFTPNGDGQNDKFMALGSFWEAFTMTIYTRWGEAVFSTNSSVEGWDGTLNGQPLPAGLYTYRIDIRDKDGQQIVKRGSVLLMR